MRMCDRDAGSAGRCEQYSCEPRRCQLTGSRKMAGAGERGVWSVALMVLEASSAVMSAASFLLSGWGAAVAMRTD